MPTIFSVSILTEAIYTAQDIRELWDPPGMYEPGVGYLLSQLLHWVCFQAELSLEIW